MLFYAFYLIYARKNKEMTSIYLYVVPIYLIAGLFCLSIAVVLEGSGHSIAWFGPDAHLEWISILGLALIPTVLGHSIINWALTRIRGQAVVIINLAQFIFAGIMGFLLLDEVPSLVFYLASMLVVLGAIIVIRHSKSTT
jgi:drug/metabolite transporter (DMT)-like permease